MQEDKAHRAPPVPPLATIGHQGSSVQRVAEPEADAVESTSPISSLSASGSPQARNGEQDPEASRQRLWLQQEVQIETQAQQIQAQQKEIARLQYQLGSVEEETKELKERLKGKVSPSSLRVLRRTMQRWTLQRSSNALKDWRHHAFEAIYNKGSPSMFSLSLEKTCSNSSLSLQRIDVAGMVETHNVDETVKNRLRKKVYKAEEVASNVTMSAAGQELAIVKLSTQNEMLRKKADECIDKLEKIRFVVIKVMIRAMRNMLIAQLGRAFRRISLGWRQSLIASLKHQIELTKGWQKVTRNTLLTQRP